MPPTIEKQNKSCLPIDDGSQHSFGLFHRTIEQPNNIFLCSLFLQATAIDLHSSLSVWISFLALVMQEIHRDGKSNIRRTRLPSAADGKDLTPRFLFLPFFICTFSFFQFFEWNSCEYEPLDFFDAIQWREIVRCLPSPSLVLFNN